MTRYVVPRDAHEIKMKDGTVYHASPAGHVVITDPAHNDEMGRGNKDYYSSSPGFFGGTHRACACGRAPWPWETGDCPHCGQTLQ